MPNTWNSRRVLGVDPSPHAVNTCVGTTLKGIRCKNTVGWSVADDLKEAGRLLDNLPSVSRCQRDQHNVLQVLKRIAWCTLCRRHHRKMQTQIDDIAERWLDTILRLPDRQVRSESPSPSSRASATSILRSRSSALSRTISTPPSSNRYSPSRVSPTPSSASTHTIFNLPSPPPTPLSSHPSQIAQSRHRRGEINITTNITTQSSSRRTDPRITIQTNLNVGPPVSTGRSTRLASRTSSASNYISSTSSFASSSTSSGGSSRRRPSRSLTISDDDTSDTAENASSGSDGSDSGRSDTDSSDSESDDNDGSNGNNPSLVEQLLRRVTELEALNAQLMESRLSSGASTPTTSTARSSFRRSNTPSLSTTRTGTSHIANSLSQRKPITRDTTCYICFDPIRRVRDATWCRGGCGQNVHHHCFGEWESAQNRVVKCAFCRSPWVYES